MKRELFILANNEKTYNNIVCSAMVSPWQFRFPNGLHPKYKDARKYYHGNSKVLLHLYYNDITGNYEMQATTATIAKSYPQHKNIKITDWESMSYEKAAEVFGDAMVA